MRRFTTLSSNVLDRTGTGDYVHVFLAERAFEGISALDQHRAVNEALDDGPSTTCASPQEEPHE